MKGTAKSSYETQQKINLSLFVVSIQPNLKTGQCEGH